MINKLEIDTSKNCDAIEITNEGTTVIARNENGEKIIVPYNSLE